MHWRSGRGKEVNEEEGVNEGEVFGKCPASDQRNI